jgi:hypothetical protein
MMRAGRLLFWPSMVLWIGGLAALAFIVAPIAFRTAGRETAGAIFGRCLTLFNRVELVAGLLALTGLLLMKPRKWGWIRPALVGAMTLNVLLIMIWLLPTMEAVRVADPAHFDSLHRLSTRLYGGTLLAGIIVIGLASWEERTS